MAYKGSTMLKVVSILYIVFSGIGILLSIFGMSGKMEEFSYMSEWSIDRERTAFSIGILMVFIIACVFNLVIGIVGVKNCKNPKGAKACFVLGIIILSLCTLSIIGTFASGIFSAYSIILMVIPVLYTYGAYQVKSNAQA